MAAEGLVRNLPIFSQFLNAASLSDSELVNFSTIARDCGVSGHTIKGYFQVLEDTLLGRWLPAYIKRPKRRVIAAPKFFFADVGAVNHLAKRGELRPGSELYGKAFENWVFHELSAHNAYSEAFATLSYWRLASGVEVDFMTRKSPSRQKPLPRLRLIISMAWAPWRKITRGLSNASSFVLNPTLAARRTASLFFQRPNFAGG